MNDVVVVGHGLTPEGRGWGSQIDACGCVVRMWNWAPWQNLLDYGQRYDYGFFEIMPSEMSRFYKYNCRFPQRGWWATRSRQHKPYEGPLPPNVQETDPVRWEREGIRLGGMGMKGRLGLTRGVRAACWALERMTKGQRLVLVGFDNVYQGRTLPSKEGFPQVYIDCPAGFPMEKYDNARQNATKSGNHDYAVEGPLLQRLAERAGVELVHSQEIW